MWKKSQDLFTVILKKTSTLRKYSSYIKELVSLSCNALALWGFLSINNKLQMTTVSLKENTCF